MFNDGDFFVEDFKFLLENIKNNLIKYINKQSQLADLHGVLQALSQTSDKQVNDIAQLNPQSARDYLVFLISHLQSIIHFCNLEHGQSLECNAVISELQNLLKPCENLLCRAKAYLTSSKSNKLNTEKVEKASVILGKEDNYVQEKLRHTEQLHLRARQGFKTKSLLFKQFLLSIWQSAIDDVMHQSHKAKKIFISYAWPVSQEEDKDPHHEAWTKDFIQDLARDLAYAGFQVFLDDFQSGAGFDLGRFMRLIQEMDHVLVVSSRTMGYKLKIPESGVNYEHQEIQAYLKQHPELSDMRFIIPLLLNDRYYAHEDWLRLAEVSFYKDGYLLALQNLIKNLYGFGSLEFNKQWQQKLTDSRIISNLWRVPAFNENFIGREALLEEINYNFMTNQKSLAITALHGLGGVGKTQIATQYVYDYCHLFNAVYWTDASSIQKLQASLVSIGNKEKIFMPEDETLSQAERANLVKDWFENRAPENWLLVCDDVETYQEVQELLPVKGGKILFTSRHTVWPRKSLSIDVFSLEEAKGYAIKILGAKKVQKEEKVLNDLIKELGRLPLALAQAFAYIQQTPNTTIADYLELYRQAHEELLSSNVLPAGDKHNPVAVTWEITFKRIENQAPEAIDLLNVLAFFHSSRIPEKISETIYTDKSAALAKLKSQKASRIATQFSMLTFNSSANEYAVHNLTQQVIRDKLKITNKVPEILITAAEALAQLFEKSKTLQTAEQRTLQKQLLPHLEAVVSHIRGIDATHDVLLQQSNLLCYLGHIHREVIGNPKTAFESYQQALTIRRRKLLLNDPQTLSVLTEVGKTHLKCGSASDIQKAIDCHKEVYEYLKLSTDYRLLTSALDNLGVACLALETKAGAEEAIKYFKQSLEYKQKHFSDDAQAIADSKTHLGNTYKLLHVQGNLDEAIKNFRSALETRQYAKPGNSLLVAEALNNLGQALVTLNGTKNIQEAIVCYLEALNICKKLLGEEHPETAEILYSLGAAYATLGGRENNLITIELYEKALEIRKQILGSEHPSVAKLLHNLGLCRVALGGKENLDKALTYHKQALDIRIKQLGADHPSVADSHTNLGRAHTNIGDKANVLEAIVHYYEGLKIREQHFGVDHPLVAVALVALASALTTLGGMVNLRMAGEHYLRAKEIREKQLGLNHPDVAHIYMDLGGHHLNLGGKENIVKAIAYHEAALKIYVDQFGEDLDTARAFNGLGNSYSALGSLKNIKKAIEYYQKNIDIKTKKIGPNHPETATAIVNKGISLNNLEGLDNVNEAERCFTQALEIFRSQLSPNHPDIAWTLIQLGTVYNSKGGKANYERARDLFQEALAIRKLNYDDNHPSIAGAYSSLTYPLTNLGGKTNWAEAQRLDELNLKIIRDQYGDNHPHTATALISAAYIYHCLNSAENYNTALAYYKEALNIRLAQFGDNHLLVAAALGLVANALKVIGGAENLLAAEELARKALTIREKDFGVDHPYYASSLIEIAKIKVEQSGLKNLTEAEELYKHALVIREQQYGKDAREVAEVCMHLGYVNYLSPNKEKLLEGRKYYERVLCIRNETLGNNHLATASVLESLGDVFFKLEGQENLKIAKQYYDQSLAIRINLFGKDDPNVVCALLSLGALSYKSGGDKEYDQALEYYKQASEIRKLNFGEEHHLSLVVLDQMAHVYYLKGDYQIAIEIYSKILKAKKIRLTKIHSDTAWTYYDLAATYGKIAGEKNSRRAIELYDKALAIFKDQFGPTHPHVAMVLKERAMEYGEFKEEKYNQMAIADIKCALEIYAKNYDEYSSDIAFCHDSLAGILVDMKTNEYVQEAIENYKTALEILKKLRDEWHEDIADLLSDLSYAYSEVGDKENNILAVEYGEQALNIRRKRLNPNHPDLIYSLSTLGAVYSSFEDKKNILKAIDYYEECLGVVVKVFGIDHQDAGMIYENLADAYALLGGEINLSRAMGYYLKAVTNKEHALSLEHPDVARLYNDFGRDLLKLNTPEAAQLALVCIKKGYQILLSKINKNDIEQGKSETEEKELDAKTDTAPVDSGSELEPGEDDAEDQDELEFKQEKTDVRTDISKDVSESDSDSEDEVDDSDIATSLCTLGEAYLLLSGKENIDKAIKFFFEAIKIEEKNYGNDSVFPAETRLYLAKAYSAVGNMENAVQCVEKSLKVRLEKLGIEHPRTAEALQIKAQILLESDKHRYSEALSCAIKALMIQENQCGQTHANVAKTLITLGHLLLAADKHDATVQSIECFTRALTVAQDQWLDGHPDIIAAEQGLQQAQEQYRGSLNVWVKAQPCEFSADLLARLGILAGTQSVDADAPIVSAVPVTLLIP